MLIASYIRFFFLEFYCLVPSNLNLFFEKKPGIYALSL